MFNNFANEISPTISTNLIKNELRHYRLRTNETLGRKVDFMGYVQNQNSFQLIAALLDEAVVTSNAV